MTRIAIISVDGHVKAPRTAYRDYIERKHLSAFDEWAKAAEGMPDGFVSPSLDAEAQWDASRRIADLESQGVVAEVLYSNGPPFTEGRVDYAPDMCPRASERLARAVHLDCSPELGDEQLEQIGDAIRKVLNGLA